MRVEKRSAPPLPVPPAEYVVTFSEAEYRTFCFLVSLNSTIPAAVERQYPKCEDEVRDFMASAFTAACAVAS